MGDGFAEQAAQHPARRLAQALGEIPQRGRFGRADAKAQGFGAGVGAGQLRAGGHSALLKKMVGLDVFHTMRGWKFSFEALGQVF